MLHINNMQHSIKTKVMFIINEIKSAEIFNISKTVKRNYKLSVVLFMFKTKKKNMFESTTCTLRRIFFKKIIS